MRNMKYFFVLVVGMILVLVSCTKEEDENPLFKITPKGAVASIANVSGFFDLLSPRHCKTIKVTNLV